MASANLNTLICASFFFPIKPHPTRLVDIFVAVMLTWEPEPNNISKVLQIREEQEEDWGEEEKQAAVKHT